MTDPNQRLSILRRNLARTNSIAERKKILADLERMIERRLLAELMKQINAAPEQQASATAELRAAGLDTKLMAELVRANPAHLAHMIDLVSKDGRARERGPDGFPIGMTEELKADLTRAGLDPKKLPERAEASQEVKQSLDRYKISEDATIAEDGFPSDMPEVLKGVLREAGLDPHKLARLAQENAERGGVMARPPKMTNGVGADGFPKDMPEEVKAIMRSAGIDPHRLNRLIASQLLGPDDVGGSERMKRVRELLKQGLDARKGATNDPKMNIEDFVQAARDSKARFADTGETGFPPDMDPEIRAQLEQLGVAGLTTTAVKIPADLSGQFDAVMKEIGEDASGRAGVLDVGLIAATSTHQDACQCAPCRLRRLIVEATSRDGGAATFVPTPSTPLH